MLLFLSLRQLTLLLAFFLLPAALALSETTETRKSLETRLVDGLDIAVRLQDAGYPNNGDLRFNPENLLLAIQELQSDRCLEVNGQLDQATWQTLQKNRLSQTAQARLLAAKAEGVILEARILQEKVEKKTDCANAVAEPLKKTPEGSTPAFHKTPSMIPLETSPATSTPLLVEAASSLLPPSAKATSTAETESTAVNDDPTSESIEAWRSQPHLPDFFWTQWALAELADRDAEFQWQLTFAKKPTAEFWQALQSFAIKKQLFTGNDSNEALLDKLKPILAERLAKTPFPVFFPKEQSFSSKQLQELAATHYQLPNFVPEKSQYTAKEVQRLLQSFDPFSRLLFQETITPLRPERLGLGIGLQVLYNDHEPPLAIPYPESAAAAAGWQQAAWLYSLDSAIARRQVLGNLSLKRGQVIRLQRSQSEKSDSSQSLHLTVGYYPRPSLISWQDGDILWLRIFNFRANETADLLAKALEKNTGKSVIFDLRYCNGGSFPEMTRALSYLLPEGQALFGHYLGEKLEKTQMRLKVPYIAIGNSAILISRYTASSAEIFTLALKNHKKNLKVLGERSFGKCTVQETRQLTANWWAEISIMEIRNTAGQSCHGQGIVPEIFFADSLFTTPKTWQERYADLWLP